MPRELPRKLLANRPTRGSLDRKERQPRLRIDLGADEPSYAIYAIGDIHGCFDLLQLAEAAIRRDVERTGIAALIILLGDYVDRGPKSADVLEQLVRPPGDGIRRLALCGNHEDLFLRFLQSPANNQQWLEMGGRETLSSYGIPPGEISFNRPRDVAALREALQNAIPEKHVALLADLPVCARIGRYVFAHAGVRPGLPLVEQSDLDMMWIREPFISAGPKLPYVLVHGHTPSRFPTLGPNRIGIDTGAYVTGRLTVLKLSGRSQTFRLLNAGGAPT